MKHAVITAPDATRLDLPLLMQRVADISTRPRYTFMVLDLIARAAGPSGRAGPHIREGGILIPIREWLCDAISPIASRHHRRLALARQVRATLEAEGKLPQDPQEAAQVVDLELRERIRTSGMTSVSRAVSELVKAGLVRRHYQGYRVDHENRGAQRLAVYTVEETVRSALGGGETRPAQESLFS